MGDPIVHSNINNKMLGHKGDIYDGRKIKILFWR